MADLRTTNFKLGDRRNFRMWISINISGQLIRILLLKIHVKNFSSDSSCSNLLNKCFLSPMTATCKNQKIETRDKLVLEYQNYARAICFKIVQQLSIPKEFLSDLIAAANLGLVEAANKFDPNYGVDFKVYAYFRIRGEAIDFLRRNTNLSTLQYRRLKAWQELENLAQSSIHQKNLLQDKSSKEEEIAKLLNLLAEGVIIYQLQKAQSPEEIYLNNYSAEIGTIRTSEKITELLEVLDEREYKIIYDFYFLDKSFVEIAKEMNNLSKSWMSRLHHQALKKMRQSYLKHSISRIKSKC